MKIIKTETITSPVTGNIQVKYWFDNGFTGYTINNGGLVLKGSKSGVVSPNTPNWTEANKLIKGQ